jgi:hypothetical protein
LKRERSLAPGPSAAAAAMQGNFAEPSQTFSAMNFDLNCLSTKCLHELGTEGFS